MKKSRFTETTESRSTIYKEMSFFGFIIEKKLNGIVLEIGGGSGFQGLLIRNYVERIYIHSDYVYSACKLANNRGLLTAQMDALMLPLVDESINIIFANGLGTIHDNSKVIRYSQFDEIYRVLKKGGDAYLVTGIASRFKGIHCIDNDDKKYLTKIGLKKISTIYIGVVPGRFWKSYNYLFFKSLDYLLAKISIGVRKVVVFTKI